MANAVAEGARSAGAQVDVNRVPETVPDEVAKSSHYKTEQSAPVAQVDSSRSTTRSSSGRRRAMGAWPRRWRRFSIEPAAFGPAATQHGGNELTLFSIIANLMHLGLTIVGLPYSFQGQMQLDQVHGGSPYGATTIAGGDGSRQPSAIDLDGARFQGKLIAETAAKIFG